MAARRLVLDANILVPAVLGKRVKAVIAAHASEAEFFVAEVAYDDAERHLPAVLIKFGRGDEIDGALGYLTNCARQSSPFPRSSSPTRRTKRWSASSSAILTIGRSLRWPWCSSAHFGLRTTTSSVPMSRPGRPTGSSVTSGLWSREG